MPIHVRHETRHGCLGDHLYMEPGPRLEAAFHEAINRLFSEGGPDSERVLALLRGLIEELFPRDRALSAGGRLALAERRSKAVYLHTHMDEDTFDVERLAQCCDSDCFPDGTSIPVCAHNVLYRETESQFVKTPVVRAPLAGGRRLPVLVAR